MRWYRLVKERYLLAISKKGYGKMTSLDEYRTQARVARALPPTILGKDRRPGRDTDRHRGEIMLINNRAQSSD